MGYGMVFTPTAVSNFRLLEGKESSKITRKRLLHHTTTGIDVIVPNQQQFSNKCFKIRSAVTKLNSHMINLIHNASIANHGV